MSLAAAWFLYQAGMLSFRAFAGGKATVVVNIRGTEIKTSSQRRDETSCDYGGGECLERTGTLDGRIQRYQHSQGKLSLDRQKRKNILFAMHPNPSGGRVFFAKEQGLRRGRIFAFLSRQLLLLLQKHPQLQVVTPRNLREFRGPVLVLPNVSILDAQEKSQLKQFVSKGGHRSLPAKTRRT